MPTTREVLEAGEPSYPAYEPRDTFTERDRVYTEAKERLETLRDEMAMARALARECSKPRASWGKELGDPRIEAWRAETWRAVRKILEPLVEGLEQPDADKVPTATVLRLLETLKVGASAMERLADVPAV